MLMYYLDTAHEEAMKVSRRLGLPVECWPSRHYSHIRCIDYPAGSGTLAHVDRSMFTLNLYRNVDTVRTVEGRHPLADEVPGLMMGSMYRKVGLGEATTHEIPAIAGVQHTLLYFAIPDLAVWILWAELMGAESMGHWHRRYREQRWAG